jgi:hypothetical protein
MVIDMKENEPEWKQTRKSMVACLKAMANGDDNEYSASNWALWQIKALEERLSDIGAYTDELEERLAVLDSNAR